MLSVVMLSVIMLSVIMLNVVMLSVIMLNVVMLNVVAPHNLVLLDSSGAPLMGRPLALPAHIRLGWRCLPRTNTLAYYKNPSITAVKVL